MANRYLNPKARNFKAEPALTNQEIFTAVKDGRAGTAMKTFSAHLDEEKMQIVADFVAHEFVKCNKDNTKYHTNEAGWPDHEKRYGAAFPFVNGELDPKLDKSKLSAVQLDGLALFRSACVTCHDLDIIRYRNENPPKKIDIKSNSRDWSGLLAAPANIKPSKDFKPYKGYAGDNPELASARAQAEYQSVSKHDEPPLPDNLTDQELLGEQLYQENCADCHAADGTGKNWVGGFLDPHPTDFTDKKITKNITRELFIDRTLNGIKNTSMPAFSAVFNKAEIAAIAAYVELVFIGNE